MAAMPAMNALVSAILVLNLLIAVAVVSVVAFASTRVLRAAVS
jgi:hypothetical protein